MSGGELAIAECIAFDVCVACMHCWELPLGNEGLRYKVAGANDTLRCRFAYHAVDSQSEVKSVWSCR